MNFYATYGQSEVDTTGTTFISGLQFVDFLYADKIMSHQVTLEQEGRLDIIAYAWYGDSTLWRYIYWYNQQSEYYPQGILDPINDVIAGMILLIPIVLSSVFIQPYTYEGTD